VRLPFPVFVRFDAKAGQLDQLRPELLAILEQTRAEPGCIDIHLTRKKSPPAPSSSIPFGRTKPPSTPMPNFLT
jgi:quinol monooxygenase YgiN